MNKPLHILVLGAAYGLLPALRIAMAGHYVTIMCRAEERHALAEHGATITFMRRDGREGHVYHMPAEEKQADRLYQLGLVGPDCDPFLYDMIFIALSEPQTAVSEISSLFSKIAIAQRPVVALLNLLPFCFLRRFAKISSHIMEPAYHAMATWDKLDPDAVTAASPDAQAVRTDFHRFDRLTVTLASNFKIAPFTQNHHQKMLLRIVQDINALKSTSGVINPVRMIAHQSVHIPLVKWPMLLTGNCRSFTLESRAVAISDAVHKDIDESRRLYDEVCAIILALGVSPKDVVPFSAYASAARSLTRPSSLARTLEQGAVAIERIDLMIRQAALSMGMVTTGIDTIVQEVEKKLRSNHIKSESI